MNHDRSGFASARACPSPAPLDYPRLVTALAAHQASSRTARLAMHIGGSDRPADMSAGALADVIEGRPGWTAAAAALDGRFHADTALSCPADAEGAR